MEAQDSMLARAWMTDPSAFGEVFDRYHRTIWRFIARVLGPSQADDLAGEVFLKAFARRHTYDPALGSLESWLYGIASNSLRMAARTRSRRVRALSRVAMHVAPPAVPTDTAVEKLALHEQMGAVSQALEQLSSSDREIIVLYAWEELCYQDIARVLGVEVGTVRSRLSRARDRLRELLRLDGKEAIDE